MKKEKEEEVMRQILAQANGKVREAPAAPAMDWPAALVAPRLWKAEGATATVWRRAGGDIREETGSFEAAAPANTAKSKGDRDIAKGLVFLLLMALLTYLPYVVQQNGWLAAYWAKISPPVFGAHVENVPPDVGRQTARGQGVIVREVAKDSPASRHGISKGDIVRKIGGLDVRDVTGFFRAVHMCAGQRVIVEIARDGAMIQKEIVLGGR
jgi:S1-C subfamily serine protease